MRSRFALLLSLSSALACGSPAAAPVNVTAPEPAPQPSVSAAKPVETARTVVSAPPASAPEVERWLAELETAREEARQVELLGKLRAVGDPRAADALARFLTSATSGPTKMLTAMALAEIHDVRATDWLLWRITPLASKADRKDDPASLGNTDESERIAAARMLGEILVRRPETRDALRPKIETAVFAWLSQRPQPHLNALRLLALVGPPTGVAKMRAWADPRAPLPKAGAMEFPSQFATAQVALRMLGLSQRGKATPDEEVWKILVKQLERRPSGVDGTMDAALSGGAAVRTMALRALALGAMQGFAEWGDTRAFPLFIKYIEDPKNNEQAKMEAAMLLPSVATDAQLRTLVAKVSDPAPRDKDKELARTCYLTALARAPLAGIDASLLPLLDATGSPELQKQAAFAIGATGVDGDVLPKLVARLDAESTRLPAATALFFGADEKTAASAVAKLASEVERDALTLAVSQAPIDDERIVASGSLARWAKNANASEAASPKKALAGALRNHTLAMGPRSLSVHLLRGRLHDDLAGKDPTRAADARILLDLWTAAP